MSCETAKSALTGDHGIYGAMHRRIWKSHALLGGTSKGRAEILFSDVTQDLTACVSQALGTDVRIHGPWYAKLWIETETARLVQPTFLILDHF
jgi:hypothetical protein